MEKLLKIILKLEQELRKDIIKFLFHHHKTTNKKMRTELADKTEAVLDTHYAIDSKAGTVTGSTQKVLVDEDDKTEEPDGDPVDLAFTADEQASIITASDAAVTAVLEARIAAASQSTQSTENTQSSESSTAQTTN